MEKREDLIIIRAYNPSKNPENRICPVRDESGNTITGQGESGLFEALTEEDIRSLSLLGLLVTPETRAKITNDTYIRLNTATGKAKWGWMQHHPYIDSERLDESVKPKSSVYYVYNKQKEAEIQVTKTKTRTLLLAEIYKMTLTEKKEVYEALGQGSSATLTDEMLEVALESQIDVNLAEVESLLNNRTKVGSSDTTARKLYHNAIDCRVIERQKSGLYTYGGEDGIPLGRKEDDIVSFFLLPENGEVVVGIQSDVETKLAE